MVRARYCTIDVGATAVLEMSEASGLWRVPSDRRDPLIASSLAPVKCCSMARRGVRKIIIGLGGSATNDGGFGMARALGLRFVDESREIQGRLPICSFVWRGSSSVNLQLPKIVAAVDVRNPLLGERGATRVFGPQKGATAEQLELLEAALSRAR